MTYTYRFNTRGAENITFMFCDGKDGLKGAAMGYSNTMERPGVVLRTDQYIMLSEEKSVHSAAEELRLLLKAQGSSVAIIDRAMLWYLDSKQEKLLF